MVKCNVFNVSLDTCICLCVDDMSPRVLVTRSLNLSPFIFFQLMFKYTHLGGSVRMGHHHVDFRIQTCQGF